jgi:hypothetical protein
LIFLQAQKMTVSLAERFDDASAVLPRVATAAPS